MIKVWERNFAHFISSQQVSSLACYTYGETSLIGHHWQNVTDY